MMIKRFFFFVVILGIWFTSLSNRGGRGLILRDALTMAPGEDGQFCGSFGCHFSGNFDPVFHVQLLDENLDITSSYVPDNEYDVLITYESSGFPTGFGFQMVSLTAEGDNPVNGWFDFPERVHEAQIDNRQYIEQNNIINRDSLLLKWQAPAANTGDVIFYFAGNLVNGNSSPGGDGADTTMLRISEDMSSSTFDQYVEAAVNLFGPIPSSGIISTNSQDLTKIEIYDLQGRMLFTTKETKRIDLEFLEPNQYLLVAYKDTGKILNQRISIN